MQPTDESDQSTRRFALATLGVAIAGSGGSLTLSMALELKPCPLCYYQRTFVLCVFAAVAIAWLFSREHLAIASLLSVPAAVAGLLVAGFHQYLVSSGKLECPSGVGGMGAAPSQSLLMFAFLSVCAILAASRYPRRGAIAASAALGAAVAIACIVSAPPLPPSPDAPYPRSQPLDTCRPPFHEKT